MDSWLQPFESGLSLTRDPDLDFIHKFKGFGIHNSTVHCQIWFHEGKAIVMFTDTGKGTSITNACEQVITEVGEKYLQDYAPRNTLFIETYDKYDRIDVIIPSYTIKNGKLTCKFVEWKPMGKILEP